MSNIRLMYGALEERPIGGNDGDTALVLRGVIHPDDLQHLRIDDYQREELLGRSNRKLQMAIREGRGVPDIEVGMRGDKASEVPDDEKTSHNWVLTDDVYIVDGLQRVTAAKALLQDGFDPQRVRIGVTVHIATNQAWERERFQILNAKRTRVSVNVILRNMRHDNQGLAAIYAAVDPQSSTTVEISLLRGRVTWSQRAGKRDLLTGLMLMKVIAHLHRHQGHVLGNGTEEMVRGLETVRTNIGTRRIVRNANTFFNLINECWGVTTQQDARGVVQLKGTFMETLAGLFSGYPEHFYEDEARVLKIKRRDVRKLKGFDVNDPVIKTLASSGGMAGSQLKYHLVEHLNKGRREDNRLVL